MATVASPSESQSNSGCARPLTGATGLGVCEMSCLSGVPEKGVVLSSLLSQRICPFVAWYALVRRGPCPPNCVLRSVNGEQQGFPQV